MTELIVALDLDSALDAKVLAYTLYDELEINWFKINSKFILNSEHNLNELTFSSKRQINIFLDLKLYDTKDTVYATVKKAFELGIKFITVHATSSMLEIAMRAKPPGNFHKVLAVGILTDDSDQEINLDHLPFIKALKLSDGVICPVHVARWFRHPKYGSHGSDQGKLLVCPGIRRRINCSDNHIPIAFQKIV